MRHIQKWLNAGVMEEGKHVEAEDGTPQGGSISPLLANLYLHYVLDLWADQWRKTRAQGEVIIVLRQTIAKRMRAKLAGLKEALRRTMHLPKDIVGKWLGRVLTGHYRYYGVPRNYRAMGTFRDVVRRLWHRVLGRRSQKGHLTEATMKLIADNWLPKPRICHPYPSQRLAVII